MSRFLEVLKDMYDSYSYHIIQIRLLHLDVPLTKGLCLNIMGYALLYVDDEICIIQRDKHVLRSEIGKYFHAKKGSVGPPTIYLGNSFYKLTMDNWIDA